MWSALCCGREGQIIAPRVDPANTGFGPGYRILRTSDDVWIALVIPDDARWNAVADVLFPDSEFRAIDVTGEVRDEVVELVQERLFSIRDAATWLRTLNDHRIPHAVVTQSNFAELVDHWLDDPATRRLGLVIKVPDAHFGAVEEIGLPITVAGYSFGPTSGSPDIGEHTQAILTELGLETTSKNT